jgi:XTP/dITP diphosphohydrolase
MKAVFVTSNKFKVNEAKRITGNLLRYRKMELDEIQEINIRKVLAHKALQAYDRIGERVVIEDTGIYINAFGGFPGALTKWMLASMGCEGICTALDGFEDRKAYAESCVALYDGKRLRVFCGTNDGRISDMPRGRKGFGFDSIFIPDKCGKTFSEMGAAEKNRISHRGIAFRKLMKYLLSDGAV